MTKTNITALFISIPLLTCALWTSSWYMAKAIAGTKPSEALSEPAPQNSFSTVLQELQTAAQENPNSVPAWEAYRDMLEAAIGHTPDAHLYSELHKTYRTLIEISDQEGSIAAKEKLADLLFGLKNFREARDLYQEVLAERPEDQSLRGRLASTLTFLQEFDAAIIELEKILAADPKSFQGHAYLSITYAQMGNQEQAMTTGEKALALAPSKEARERFQAFLDSFPRAEQETPEVAQSPLETYLTTNPITKRKFVSLEKEGTAITLLFKDFPVQAMPEVAKNKFVSNLKEKAANQEVSEIILLDAISKKELLRISLP